MLLCLILKSFVIRVFSGSKSYSTSQIFTFATPGSVWHDIYHQNMNEDSFRSDAWDFFIKAKGQSRSTYFGELYSDCDTKFAWSSHQKQPRSFVFPKKSSLIPFFNTVVAKLGTSGTLNAIFERRYISTKAICFNDEAWHKIPLENIPLLLAILGMAIIISFIIFSVEWFWQTSPKTKSGTRFIQVHSAMSNYRRRRMSL